MTSTAGACTNAEEPETPSCVAVARDCAPLYEPTFEALFLRTLNPSCGIEGSTCHQGGGAGTKGGLTFDSPRSSYAALLDTSRSWRLVAPGDPECSKVVYRIASHDLGEVMPPGRPLSAAEQCTIVTWIARGAPP